MYLKGSIVIIFSIVIVINSEQWYPAMIVSNQTQAFDTVDNNPLNNSQNPLQSYLPLSVSKYDNQSIKVKWHFSQNRNMSKHQSTTTITSYATDILKEQAFLFTDPVAYKPHDLFENRDTLGKSNNTQPIRPKRKVAITKRCQSTLPRDKKQQRLNDRKGKFLEVFEVVQFEHVTCTSSSGLEGKCLPEYGCQIAGGIAMGSCADNFGTCCVIQFVCDESSSAPIGWFTNSYFPTPNIEKISCTITLEKSSFDIQQIRLDFLIFEMLPPTSGTCEDDQFVVSGQDTNKFIPILCGINTGQHVYIEVRHSDGPIYLSVQTVTPENRLYAVKVTQLSDSDELAAPKGCLQYYKDPDGYLESFNYRDNSDIVISRYPSYLNNLNYAMCIERAITSCRITYTNAGELQIPNYDTDGLPVIPPKQAGVEIFNCPSDWLLISAIRLCGERLNDGSVLQDFSLDAPVTDDAAGPIVIWFRSDGGYVGRGFKLYYLQNTCK